MHDYEIDPKIRRPSLEINEHILCGGIYFTCEGHPLDNPINKNPSDEPVRSLVSYFGVYENNKGKRMMNRIHLNIGYKPPYLTLWVLNPDEKKTIIKNCQKIKYKKINIEIINMDDLDNKKQAKEKIKEYLKRHKGRIILLGYFKDTWNGGSHITFTLFPKLKDKSSKDEISDKGKEFYEKILSYLKELDLKTHRTLDGNEKCECEMKEKLCEPIFRHLVFEEYKTDFEISEEDAPVWASYLLKNPFVKSILLGKEDNKVNLKYLSQNYRLLYKNREMLKDLRKNSK